MFDVDATLSAITIGPPLASGGLTMWPLVGQNGLEPAYDLAGDAFRAGTVQVNAPPSSRAAKRRGIAFQ